MVTFCDVASTFSDCVMMKHKSKVADHFKTVISRWEKDAGYSVKTVRTDGGGEYELASFEKWLDEKGIRHERSNPYEPEQNGVAEHLNRTLGDMARTMLADSGLPKLFWNFAYLAACFLHN